MQATNTIGSIIKAQGIEILQVSVFLKYVAQSYGRLFTNTYTNIFFLYFSSSILGSRHQHHNILTKKELMQKKQAIA